MLSERKSKLRPITLRTKGEGEMKMASHICVCESYSPFSPVVVPYLRIEWDGPGHEVSPADDCADKLKGFWFDHDNSHKSLTCAENNNSEYIDLIKQQTCMLSDTHLWLKFSKIVHNTQLQNRNKTLLCNFVENIIDLTQVMEQFYEICSNGFDKLNPYLYCWRFMKMKHWCQPEVIFNVFLFKIFYGNLTPVSKSHGKIK